MDYEIVKLKWMQGFAAAILKDGSALHLWLPQWYHTDLRFIHNHNYYFTSTVLMGTLQALEFSVTPDPEGSWWYETKYAHSVYLHFVEHMKYMKGHTYEFGGVDRFHKVTHKGPVMTHCTRLRESDDRDSGFLIKNDQKNSTFEVLERPSADEIKQAFCDIVTK